MKNFKLRKEDIKDVLKGYDKNEGRACFASDRITVDGCRVGYMYREYPDNDNDSGWRFLAGDETDEYVNNPDNSAIYDLNTICNYDIEIMPYLNVPYNTAYGRDENGVFQNEDFEISEDE